MRRLLPLFLTGLLILALAGCGGNETSPAQTADMEAMQTALLAADPTLGVLKVTSVAGSGTNKTIVTVDAPKVFGTSYVYKLGNSPESVNYGQAPGSGWTKLIPGTPIAASSNTTITVAQVNDTKGGIAIASGSATIVKKD